jgi:hypothetical protein
MLDLIEDIGCACCQIRRVDVGEAAGAAKQAAEEVTLWLKKMSMFES